MTSSQVALAQMPPPPAPNERSKPEVSVASDVMKALQKASPPLGPASKSTFVKPAKPRNVSGAMPLVRLQLLYLSSGTADDARSTLLAVGSGLGAPPPAARLHLTQFLPHLTIRAFEDPVMRTDVEAALPIRSVQQGRSDLPVGSEFGGVYAGLRNTIYQMFQVTVGYADRRSTKLGLHDPIREVTGGLALLRNERSSRDTIDIQARSELEGRMAVGGPVAGLSGVQTEYGPAWGVRTQTGLTFGFGEGGILRLGAEALFRRVVSYRTGGLEQGGTGLLSITPYLEYGLTPDIALGVRYDFAPSRPIGREHSLGDPSLAGLYGNSFGANLRVSTF